MSIPSIDSQFKNIPLDIFNSLLNKFEEQTLYKMMLVSKKWLSMISTFVWKSNGFEKCYDIKGLCFQLEIDEKLPLILLIKSCSQKCNFAISLSLKLFPDLIINPKIDCYLQYLELIIQISARSNSHAKVIQYSINMLENIEQFNLEKNNIEAVKITQKFQQESPILALFIRNISDIGKSTNGDLVGYTLQIDAHSSRKLWEYQILRGCVFNLNIEGIKMIVNAYQWIFQNTSPFYAFLDTFKNDIHLALFEAKSLNLALNNFISNEILSLIEPLEVEASQNSLSISFLNRLSKTLENIEYGSSDEDNDIHQSIE